MCYDLSSVLGLNQVGFLCPRKVGGFDGREMIICTIPGSMLAHTDAEEVGLVFRKVATRMVQEARKVIRRIDNSSFVDKTSPKFSHVDG